MYVERPKVKMALNILYLPYRLMANRNFRKKNCEVFTFREYRRRIEGYN